MRLGIDLGRHAGIAYGPKGGPCVLEESVLSQDVGKMMSEFEGAMRGYIRRLSPEFIVWERPFVIPNRHDAQGELRTQRLYGQSACMMKLAHEYDIRWDYQIPTSLRKSVMRRGAAKEDEIMKFCRTRGVNPSTDHQADAFIAWLYATEKCK